MTLTLRMVNFIAKGLTHVICRVHDAALDRIPQQGPLILVANHVNFLDLPVVLPRINPRPVTGFAKAETWDNPFMAFLFNLWGAIPLKRGEVDLSALRKALEALEAGKIVAVAPEGTRSGDGKLQRGRPGVVLLAHKSGAPLLPMAYYGGEAYKQNIRRLRRTDFHIAVGNPFYLRRSNAESSRQVRQLTVDEIMYQLAALLPESYRGAYADLSAASEDYLEFKSGSTSNIREKTLEWTGQPDSGGE